MPDGLRTAKVSIASGYSPQQVRNLEGLGVIPAAQRGVNGYREYSTLHVEALNAYRWMAVAVGPVDARALLIRLRGRGLAEAAAEVDLAHMRLAHVRARVTDAQVALDLIQTGSVAHDLGDTMTISELAEALGVRTSTLRFWEKEGLVAPQRVTSLRARLYDPRAIRDARIVAALRGAGYRIPAIREVVATLDTSEGTAAAAELLRARLLDLSERSIALMRAGGSLANILSAQTEIPGEPESRRESPH